jgi:GNAT superfamily N-acetyltransferase
MDQARAHELQRGSLDDYVRALAAASPDSRLIELGAVIGAATPARSRSIANDGDCGIYLVATAPRQRGRGLATRLLAAALAEAAARGCATSTLQSSPQGRPIYEALGYEPQFALHLYERRRG